MVQYIDELWKNRTSKASDAIEESSVSFEENLAITIILSIFSVVGTLGNGLVLYVFTRTTGKLTSTVFIIALAGTDFITCLVIMPFTVAAIQTEYRLAFDILCKLYQFLITCTVPLSAFIMVAIAVDRYICICHPFAHIMTVTRAKIIVSILAAFACVLGVITSLGFSLYQVVDANNVTEQSANTTTISHPFSSTVIDNTNRLEAEPIYVKKFNGICELSNVLLSKDFFEMYHKIYSAFYLVSLLIVLILYGLIYSSVTKQRAKRRAQKLGSRAKQVNSQCQTDETTIPLTSKDQQHNANHNAHLKVEMDGQTACTRLTEHQENGVSASGQKSMKQSSVRKLRNAENHREKRDHDRLANIKTAVMLFIVTIVFIIAFLPAWLMAHRWLKFNAVVFYMYFIYNVANPVIYAFMNQMFRENMFKIFTC